MDINVMPLVVPVGRRRHCNGMTSSTAAVENLSQLLMPELCKELVVETSRRGLKRYGVYEEGRYCCYA